MYSQPGKRFLIVSKLKKRFQTTLNRYFQMFFKCKSLELKFSVVTLTPFILIYISKEKKT